MTLYLPDGFSGRGRLLNRFRWLNGFGWLNAFVFDGLGMANLSGDDFLRRNGLFFLNTKPFLHPAAHLFNGIGQPLCRR